ncbi:MAG: DUF3185 domain-containing protein [Candidatus Zixiibacteriota bacterium]
MKVMTIVGIILIVLGAIGLIYGGITYTSSKDVIDLGAVKLEVDQQKQIPLSPIFGGIAMVLGVILVVAGRRRLS